MSEVDELRSLLFAALGRIDDLELAMSFVLPSKLVEQKKAEVRSTKSLDARVLLVLRDVQHKGICRTGKKSLYQLKDRRLAGLTRRNIEDAVNRILDDGEARLCPLTGAISMSATPRITPAGASGLSADGGDSRD